MNLSKKCIATKALLLFAFWSSCAIAMAAQVAGTVTQLSGPLLAKKASGTVKILSLKSEVESGDTLVTEKNTYAMVKFIDNSEITLKPSTTFTIDNFAFDNAKPDDDNASFNLVKGGMRSVSGLLGKRNKEKFALKTPTATIGIRGTTFIADFVPGEDTAVASLRAYLNASTAALGDSAPIAPLQLAQGPLPVRPPSGPSLAPGLYVHVIDGLIRVSNPAGASNFSAGQFGYTPNPRLPPVVVPTNPGILFTPPPSFSQSSGAVQPGANSQAKSNQVDCEVR
ncbi:FecR family protein [Pseudoduganella namucuonensis]|uniref:FecR family protein n=1 Tax=Pseudoduganella namucuonensis TaxID=1035707 RepID=A0A1I7IW23_9BURK|nr:FecR family protein [Pseudoduganella namucuonensis]SFU77133.1 FecR family protein [Pseudoduganella namucuonensis]